MSLFLDVLRDRALLFDGGMGSQLQGWDLGPDDYEGHESCIEILNLSRPEVVREVHERYLAAGADVVETNTFGANRSVLSAFGLEDRVEEMNAAAAALALEAAHRYESEARPRFVAGSLGPGTRLPSLGQASFRDLESTYREQAEVLLRAGVDILLIETCQDVLQAKAAIAGLCAARRNVGRQVPLMVQVTLGQSGHMLVGTDVAAALAILEAFPYAERYPADFPTDRGDVATIGLNCSTGPAEMAAAVTWLCRHARRPVSVQPNAGLPEIENGEAVYKLSPSAFADWQEHFVLHEGVAIAGGCCGTTPAHIAELDRRLRGRRPARRIPSFEASLASLYHAVPMRQEADVLAIGERTNANGSEIFRKRLVADDWDGIVALGRAQLRQGSHAVDVCTAMVGRDERADMVEVVSRFRTAVDAPLVLDTTEPAVLEAALELHGGKCLVNSIHLEDGGARARRICQIARKYGAAVIGLCIDEEGMARTPERKLAVAERVYELAIGEGIDPCDLLFDPLTFTLATGQENDRPLGHFTLQGVRLIAERFPKCGVILGVSNISYGLVPAARAVLNAVMLHEARQRGLSAAILHASRMVPLYRIPDAQRSAAQDLLFDRHPRALVRFIELFPVGASLAPAGAAETSTTEISPEERLVRRVIDGDAHGLAADVDLALERLPAERILSEALLRGMKTVGELFGRGAMQLPFVLQSAEVMKSAVALLEPHLQRRSGAGRRRILLATVWGDVHDIGKNLVNILLTNNGFEVIDLGIKVDVSEIVAALDSHKPDALGMSGLLVRSTATMRDNLVEIARRGFHLPVILGGAALTRSFVEQDCSRAYGQPVVYARDAFDGLRFMESLEAAGSPPSFAPPAPPFAARPATRTPPPPQRERARRPRPLDVVPEAPFWGSRVLPDLALHHLLPLLDEPTLFTFHWGFSRKGQREDAYAEQIRTVVRPLLADLLARADASLLPQAVYGFFRCQADHETLLVFTPDGRDVIAKLPFPRLYPNGAPDGAAGLCVADYFRPFVDAQGARSPAFDVVGLQAVTLGFRLTELEKTWFEQGLYRDYVCLHGLGAELAEAAASWVHRLAREQLGLVPAERIPGASLHPRARGRRYAPGYAACPDLAVQADILRLLDAARIGLGLTEAYQLLPEQSSTAIVVHHPDARYFAA
jgi:5-methyltetrahydrofolate--homocysteine methyltransferase